MDNTINFIRVFFIWCLFKGNVLLCTLPSYMEGTWSDSKFYDVEFTGGTDMFLASYSITRQGTTTNMTCHISEDNKYVMRTKNTARAAVDGIDGQYYYYICMEITKITDYSFYYYLQSDIDSNSERTIPINENSTQSDTVATYCTTTIGLHLFHIMVKNGFEANAIQTCSPPLLGEFTYELTTVPGFCRTTTGTIGFMDESYSTFNVTEVPGNVCNFKFGNSATRHVGCLVCIQSGNIYITSLINLDGSYDNVYYYKFTCMMSVHEEDKVMLSQRARVCHADQNVNSIPDHSKLYPQDIPLAVALINLDPNGTEVTRDVICFPIHSISEGEKNLAWIAAVVIILVLIIVAIIIFIYCKKIKRGNKIKSQEPRKRKFVFDIRTALTAGLGRQKSFLRSENIVQDRKQNKVKRFEEETELNHPEETSSVNGDVFITGKTPTLVERFPTQHEITITNSKNNENSIKGVETSSEADKETFDQVVRNQGSSYKVPESKETVLIVHKNKRINVGLMKDSINLVKERSHPTDVNKNIKQSNDSKENLHHIESQDYGIPLQSKVVPSDLTVTKDHFKTNGYSTESQSHDTENREHNFAIDTCINDTENSKNVKDDDPQHVELKDKQFIEMCKSKDHETKTSTLKTSDDKSLEQNFSTDMTENSPLTSKSIHTEINQTLYPAHDDLETTMQMSEKQIVKGKQRLISTPIVHTEQNKVEGDSKEHHSENDPINNEIYNRDSSNKKKLATSQMMPQTKSHSHYRTSRSSTPMIHRKGQNNELEHPMYNDEKTTKTHYRDVKSPLKLPFDVEIHEEEDHKPVENLLNSDQLRANKQKFKKSKYSKNENTTRTETLIPQPLSDRSAGSGAGDNEIHNFLKLNLQIPEETSVKFTKQYNKYKSPISNQSLQNEKKMKIRKQILKKKSQQETATSEVQYFY